MKVRVFLGHKIELVLIGWLIFAFSLWPFPLLAMKEQSQSRPNLPLSLDDCIVLALKNNLNLAVEKFAPEIAETSASRAKEIFLPRFELNYGRQRQESPPYWWIQGATTIVTKYQDYSFSINQQLPIGGYLSLSFQSYRSDTNQAFQLINPRYGSTIRFDLTLPLLRDFGPKMSRREIILATKNAEVAWKQYEAAIAETIYAVEEAYWNLVFAIENLKVKQASLQLARDLLRKNQKEVEVGKLAPIELLNAEAEVASREAELIQAERVVERAEQILHNLLNLEADPQKAGAVIIPQDQPEFIPRKASAEEALNLALTKRPEIEQLKKNIEIREFNLAMAKNELLPRLDFQLAYWSPGISGDRLLYLNDNPFLGVIVGREKGSASDSIRDALKLLYQNWTVGLNLSFPLSNLTSRANYASARLELERSQARLKSLEQQIRLEVSDTLRDIETNAKRVEALRIARERAEKRLQAEEKKMAVGLTTNYFVLQYQAELANARSLELRAIVDYILAWAKLEKITGQNFIRYQEKIN
ncbi:MAG: TolC family protein [Candidatus Aminicenantes bacterium]|nr:TolC family protein [Candidatus Aminicenantes bacterium]